MKKLIAIFAFLSLASGAFSQAPDGINYQAVIRDNAGAVLTNSPVGMKIAIRQTFATGTVVYEESFTTTTSAYGLVNIVVGQGSAISGNFASIDWSNGPYFVEVAADETGGTNYSLLGTQQLMSVAYALYANTAENATNDLVDDADADPTNELQDISLSGTDLSISNGSTVDLSVLQDGTGTDDQNISGSGLAGTDLTIGIEGGGSQTIDLSTLQDGTGTDDQNISGSGLAGTDLTIGIEGGASETVDLSTLQDGTGTDDQNISGSGLTGTDLTIGIEGGASETVDLSTLQDGTGTDDQTLNLTGTDLSIESGNTVDLSSLQDGTGTDDQNISGSGLAGTDLTIGIEGGTSETVDLSSLQDGVTDADADPTNELQALSLSGDTLYLSNGNGVYIGGVGGNGSSGSPSGSVVQYNANHMFYTPSTYYDGDTIISSTATLGGIYNFNKFHLEWTGALTIGTEGFLIIKADTVIIDGAIDGIGGSNFTDGDGGGAGGGGGRYTSGTYCAVNGVAGNNSNNGYYGFLQGGAGAVGGPGQKGETVDTTHIFTLIDLNVTFQGAKGAHGTRSGSSVCTGCSTVPAGLGGKGLIIVTSFYQSGFTSTIDLSGENGNPNVSYCAPSGGGGGGCMVVKSNSYGTLDGVVNVAGGLGGNSSQGGGNKGGAGGDGIVIYITP